MAAETSIQRARRIAKEKREGKNKKPTGKGKVKKPETNVGNRSQQEIDALEALEQGVKDADEDSKRKK